MNERQEVKGGGDDGRVGEMRGKDAGGRGWNAARLGEGQRVGG